MKTLAITIHNDNSFERSKPLRESCEKGGFEFKEYIFGFTFGQQYHLIKEICEEQKDNYTHLIYNDAWDVLCFGTQKETEDKFNSFNAKMIISAEKACFPFVEKAILYPQSNTVWKYINGGGSMFEIDYFLWLCEQHPFAYNYIDPDWLLTCFLANQQDIKLDHDCHIFQPIAHSDEKEWVKTSSRFKNVATGTQPIFFHGNGHTDMTWLKDTI